MPNAARVLDQTTHPGSIAGPGVWNVLIKGKPAAVKGDIHVCAFPPLAGPHPPNTVKSGSATVRIGGRAAARTGDLTGCGALIGPGADNVLIGD